MSKPSTPKAPIWAKAAPLFYLATCAVALKVISTDPSANVGVPGILLAVGLVPAFVIPAIFSS